MIRVDTPMYCRLEAFTVRGTLTVQFRQCWRYHEEVPPGRRSQLIHRRTIDFKNFIYRSVETHLLESCILSSPNASVGFRACGQAVFTNILTSAPQRWVPFHQADRNIGCYFKIRILNLRTIWNIKRELSIIEKFLRPWECRAYQFWNSPQKEHFRHR